MTNAYLGYSGRNGQDGQSGNAKAEPVASGAGAVIASHHGAFGVKLSSGAGWAKS